MDFKLGIFGSHNSAIGIAVDNKVKEVIELERWVGIKNAAFAFHFPIDNPENTFKEMLKNDYNFTNVENFLKVEYHVNLIKNS